MLVLATSCLYLIKIMSLICRPIEHGFPWLKCVDQFQGNIIDVMGVIMIGIKSCNAKLFSNCGFFCSVVVLRPQVKH